MPQILTEEQITSALETLPEWTREGGEITRTFAFASYLAGIAFVDKIALDAEAANHHPDIFIGWRKVTLRLTTHSKGGLTEKDIALAQKCDQAAAAPKSE